MDMHNAFFCLDCESIENPVTTENELQCPRCASRAIWPVKFWLNPYRCNDCGHIARPIATDLGLRCERCTSINIKQHVVTVGSYPERRTMSAPVEVCHA